MVVKKELFSEVNKRGYFLSCESMFNQDIQEYMVFDEILSQHFINISS